MFPHTRFHMPRCLLPLLLCLAGPVLAQSVPEADVEAVRAADEGAYDVATELSADPVTRDLVRWIQLRAGDGTFGQYAQFLVQRPDWPGRSTIRARAEEALPKGTDPDLVIAFFNAEAPRTGEGAVRLAEAMIAKGQIAEATKVVQAAWRDLRLTDSGQDVLVAGFADLLTPVHNARVDQLLWRWRTAEAQRMMDLLDEDQQALAKARIAYIRKTGGIDAAVKAVPEALQDHPGLAYDRYNWLADTGSRTEAVKILSARSVSEEALGEPFRWSGWRRSLARWEMREGRPQSAYALASQHFLTEGSSFADLEWLAGYVQLTYLDDAAKALAHFETARAAVESPISVARMAYWQGRAQEALGSAEAAQTAYAEAAQHQTAFYGLLAAEKLGRDLDPALAAAAPAWDASVMDMPLVQAAFTMLEAEERGAATQFFVQVGRELPAEVLGAIGAGLTDADEVYFAVAMGKAAVTQGKIVPSIYFPLHPLADTDLKVEPALALSIARRESEFNAGVGSPVGALGLMQLMPATAEEVAGFEGVVYSRPRLTGDWAYNARLGDRYLAELIAQFGPSVVQIAAGYNAGPSRPENWMDDRGDPRLGEADVVDWIEHIPFRETRNYVQRVSESIPVYRARLTGEAGPVRFTALLNGEKPIVRPVSRGEAPVQGESAVVTEQSVSTSDAPPLRAVARPTRPAAPTGPTGIRPIARPGD